MTQNSKINDKRKVLKLLRQNFSNSDIGRVFGCSKQAVSNYIRKHELPKKHPHLFLKKPNATVDSDIVLEMLYEYYTGKGTMLQIAKERGVSRSHFNKIILGKFTSWDTPRIKQIRQLISAQKKH